MLDFLERLVLFILKTVISITIIIMLWGFILVMYERSPDVTCELDWPHMQKDE